MPQKYLIHQPEQSGHNVSTEEILREDTGYKAPLTEMIGSLMRLRQQHSGCMGNIVSVYVCNLCTVCILHSSSKEAVHVEYVQSAT